MIITPTNCAATTPTTNMVIDDDSSTCSSTVEVLGVSKQPQDAHTAAAAPQTNRMEERHPIRKTVRFNENLNQSYANVQVAKEDCKRLWYTGRDFSDFKAANKLLAAQITRSEQRSMDPHSYQRILYRTYEACCRYEAKRAATQTSNHVHDNNNDDDETVNDPTELLDKQDEQQLRQWLDVATARLGLERSAVRDIARDRYYRYKDLVKNVLDVQTQMEQYEVEPSAETKAEYLRQCCQAISRPSQIFARQLARAQAPLALC